MDRAVRLAKYSPVLFGGSYARKVLSTRRASLIAYWPLWEASGSVAINMEGTVARDGSYTGVTLGQPGIGDGRTCPLFDGANDYANIYSASLNAAFDPLEFSVSIWFKVYNAGVWTDGTNNRTALRLLGNPSTGDFYFQKNSNNQVVCIYRAGGVNKSVSMPGLTSVDWIHFAATVSASSDEFKVYRDGIQAGTTQTGLGVWSGVLQANGTIIGSLTTTPSGSMYGYLAHAAIWSGVQLTQPEIAKLAQV